MTDISKYLPKQSKTVAAIFAHHKQVGDAEQARGYLGASIIGHPCERYLWYTFRACCKPEFDGRMYRIFETGNLAEDRFIRELRCIGCEVHNVAESGGQFAVSAFGGHFSGHMDGCALGIPESPKIWHVLEFKTHNVKSFAKLAKEGVKQAKPQHYAQMMVYMHLSGMTRALYLAVNKDTDDLHSERVYHDKQESEIYMRRAEYIINATSPPERITDRQDYWECKYCDVRDICWGKETCALPVPVINCRQCCHATPTMAGTAQWMCERHKRGLDPASQARACKDHLVLPGLITFADQFDFGDNYPNSGNNWIEYKIHNKDVFFRNGNGGVCYSTEELMRCPMSVIVNPTAESAKELFGAKVMGYCPDDIISRYPDARVVWQGPITGLMEAWRRAFQEHIVASKKIANCDAFDCQVAEFTEGRLAIVYPHTKQAEIRQGIE